MTQSTVTLMYVITSSDDGEVLIVSTTQEKATQLLSEYMGHGKDKDVIYDGFTKIEYSEFEDDYIGYYKFRAKYGFSTEYEVDKFRLYCKVLDTV